MTLNLPGYHANAIINMVIYKSRDCEVYMMGRPEDERVKIPALVHFTRLDYEYVSLKKSIA